MLFCSLKNGLTPKIRMLCFVIINSVLFNLLNMCLGPDSTTDVFLTVCVFRRAHPVTCTSLPPWTSGSRLARASSTWPPPSTTPSRPAGTVTPGGAFTSPQSIYIHNYIVSCVHARARAWNIFMYTVIVSVTYDVIRHGDSLT